MSDLSCGLMTHSYDYIHYHDRTDAFDAMIKNTGESYIRRKKQTVEGKVKKINTMLETFYNGKTKIDNVYGSRSVARNVEVADFKRFALGDSGITGVMNLGATILERPTQLNTKLNTVDKYQKSNSGSLQALRRFLGYFGGEISLIKNGNELEVGLIPDESFSTQSVQPLDISKLSEILNTINESQINLKAIQENHGGLKGLGGEIAAGLFAAVALMGEKEAYEKIENKGRENLKANSKNLKITSKLQSTIREKQQQLNTIKSALSKANIKADTVDISQTFDKQGKVDVTVHGLNISAKNYWSNERVKLSDGTKIASIFNLISAYYPTYGWNTNNYHVFLNSLVKNHKNSAKMNELKDTYLRIMKNVLIGYDVDVLFISKFGIPKFYNAWDAYLNNNLFSINDFQSYENQWIGKKKSKQKDISQDALNRSQRVWFNIMSSKMNVKEVINKV